MINLSLCVSLQLLNGQRRLGCRKGEIHKEKLVRALAVLYVQGLSESVGVLSAPPGT